MLKKFLIVTIFIVVISISLFGVVIPLAIITMQSRLRKQLRETPLPERTEIIDSVSLAGK